MARRTRRRALHRRPAGRRETLAMRLSVVVALGAAGAGITALTGAFAGTRSPGRAVRVPPAATVLPTTTVLPTATVLPVTTSSAATSPATTAVPAATTAPPAATIAPPTTSVAVTTTLPAPPAPSSVLVEVLNGSGQTGAATDAGAALQRAGFLLNGTGNAPSFLNQVTRVVYPPGEEEAAEVLAGRVAGATELEASPALPGGVVDLVLGDSFQGIVAS